MGLSAARCIQRGGADQQHRLTVRSGHANAPAAEKYANRMPTKESVSTNSGARAIFAKSEGVNIKCEGVNMERSLWVEVVWNTRIMPRKRNGTCDLRHSEIMAPGALNGAQFFVGCARRRGTARTACAKSP